VDLEGKTQIVDSIKVTKRTYIHVNRQAPIMPQGEDGTGREEWWGMCPHYLKFLDPGLITANRY